MSLPDDFIAGLFWGVLVGVALFALLLWGLDAIDGGRRRRRDLRYLVPPTARGSHTPPARNPPPSSLP
ncbi:hypothetical protein A7A76_07640 [Lysobacter enzymogenes]|uniref:hypothetical protein n=1 Tax=Lysobacter enzymogenes TaxID=69 RepID=UPI0019D0B371|nr:hypothetical protein [Lysobacter enzymogenes]MBN7138965.1 hypothetical protein [Lysobacter enzymogenes]